MKTVNEEIAEYEGLEVCDCGNGTKHYKVGPMHFQVCYVNDLGYDTSWNRLMPIIKKISSLYSKFDGTTLIKGDYERSRFLDVVALPIYTELNEAHEAVGRFCQWFNHKDTQRTYLEQNGPKV